MESCIMIYCVSLLLLTINCCFPFCHYHLLSLFLGPVTFLHTYIHTLYIHTYIHTLYILYTYIHYIYYSTDFVVYVHTHVRIKLFTLTRICRARLVSLSNIHAHLMFLFIGFYIHTHLVFLSIANLVPPGVETTNSTFPHLARGPLANT